MKGVGRMSKKGPITCCPHCGSTMGFYTLSNYMRVPYEIGFDGEQRDNSSMYENADIQGGNMAYCMNCGKAICRLSTIKKRNGIF